MVSLKLGLFYQDDIDIIGQDNRLDVALLAVRTNFFLVVGVLEKVNAKTSPKRATSEERSMFLKETEQKS